jgi:hypothetical protein
MTFDVTLTTAQGLAIAEIAYRLHGAKRAQEVLGVDGQDARVLLNAARAIAKALPKTPASRKRSKFVWEDGDVRPNN